MKIFLSIFFIFSLVIIPCNKLFSQIALSDSSKIKISGYIDTYYAAYIDSVKPGTYEAFPSISPRSNQVGLNTAMLTTQYDGEKVRGVITLHYGDIAKCAWSPTFNPIMEAHIGVRLSKNNKWWLDAGFFRTHFGTEGLLPRENFCSSVSVNTVYEPYYESGIRLNYNPSEKLSISIYGLNGYNMFEDNNHKKSLGTNITYALGEKGNCGYTNYIGDDSPLGDTISHLRILQNLFFNYQFGKLKFQIGGDYCIQKNSGLASPTSTGRMASGVMSFKYLLRKKFSVYARGEFFDDPNGFVSTRFIDWEGNVTGYKMWGATAGVEYKPTENSYIRLESREIVMNRYQRIFWNVDWVNKRTEILCNFGISF